MQSTDEEGKTVFVNDEIQSKWDPLWCMANADFEVECEAIPQFKVLKDDVFSIRWESQATRMDSGFFRTPARVDVSYEGEMLHFQGQQGVHPRARVSDACLELVSTLHPNFFISPHYVHVIFVGGDHLQTLLIFSPCLI